MRAEILSIGTELLLGSTVDTNAALMGELLAEWGISCVHRQTVGDNLERMVAAIQLALSRADIVLCIGGLGPTVDDLTREAIAESMGETLSLNADLKQHIREIFASRNLRWVESNVRQAMLPPSGTPIENPFGTAPGLACRFGEQWIIAMPGPPREFKPMATGPVKELLVAAGGGGVIHSRVLRICGLGESRVEELTRDLMDQDEPTVAPYAKAYEVHLRVTARGKTIAEAEHKIKPVEAKIRRRLGWHVYGTDDVDLESAVIHRLVESRLTVCTAESCTGGMIAARLASVPGSSTALIGGIVAYQSEVKVRELGVSKESLAQFTAVSEAVAQQMAEGAKDRFQTHFAIAVTGVAGPGPDADGNPEGLVILALSSPTGTEVQRHQFGRGRAQNRDRATQLALTMIWRALQTEQNPLEQAQ